MEDYKWEKFEKSGKIIDYLRFKNIYFEEGTFLDSQNKRDSFGTNVPQFTGQKTDNSDS